MSDRVFTRYTFKFVVLVEGEIPDDMSTEDIAHECYEGNYSGIFETEDLEYLSPQEMAQALMAQGSDPSFFMLHEDSTEWEDDGRSYETE